MSPFSHLFKDSGVEGVDGDIHETEIELDQSLKKIIRKAATEIGGETAST